MNTNEQTTRARTPEIKVQREVESHIVPSPHHSPRHAGSRGSTPEKSSPKHVKGTRAKFIRQNPRFINTPICQMVPSEGNSVADCLDWKQEDPSHRHRQTSPKLSSSPESTLRRDYRPPSPDTRPHPLHRHSPQKTLTSNIPIGHDPNEKGRERISFRHLYDCRAEPSQPDRGKLHGSFVWEPLPKPSHDAPINFTDSPSRAKSSPS